MPAVTPLPLHFGLHRFKEIGETEFWIANETEGGYCGKFFSVFDGQTCPYHYHRVKHETFFVVKGTLRMRVGQEERILSQGGLLVMRPTVGHASAGRRPTSPDRFPLVKAQEEPTDYEWAAPYPNREST